MSDLVPMDHDQQQAKLLAASDLVPDAYRNKPANVYLAILTGHALGIHPVTALSSIQIIKGKPTMSAELMRALVQQAGHKFRILEASESKAEVECARKEWPGDVSTFTFTMTDAHRAGLDKQETYRKFPQAMLLARVTSMAARAMFADVIAGVSYTPDELVEAKPEPAVAPVVTHLQGPALRREQQEPLSKQQKAYMGSLVRQVGYEDTEQFLASEEANKILGGAPSSPLLKNHASTLISALEAYAADLADALAEPEGPEAVLLALPTPEEAEQGGSDE